jgi:hypothetical protein
MASVFFTCRNKLFSALAIATHDKILFVTNGTLLFSSGKIVVILLRHINRRLKTHH